jgi:hypothetical protein
MEKRKKILLSLLVLAVLSCSLWQPYGATLQGLSKFTPTPNPEIANVPRGTTELTPTPTPTIVQ